MREADSITVLVVLLLNRVWLLGAMVPCASTPRFAERFVLASPEVSVALLVRKQKSYVVGSRRLTGCLPVVEMVFTAAAKLRREAMVVRALTEGSVALVLARQQAECSALHAVTA